MSESTDLEACKKIAEIEGKFNFISKKIEEYNSKLVHVQEKHTFLHRYNPLTDGALLNQLIFKYEISISFNFCLISMITNKQYEINFTDIPSLKRNCLLLIIEAHKDKS